MAVINPMNTTNIMANTVFSLILSVRVIGSLFSGKYPFVDGSKVGPTVPANIGVHRILKKSGEIVGMTFNKSIRGAYPSIPSCKRISMAKSRHVKR